MIKRLCQIMCSYYVYGIKLLIRRICFCRDKFWVIKMCKIRVLSVKRKFGTFF